MIQKLIIQANHLPDLNKYIHQERTSRYSGAKIKKEWTNITKMLAIANKLKPMQSPVEVYVSFYKKNKKVDKDNLLVNIKFLLDGLVAAGVLHDDGWDDILHLGFHWYIDPDNDERMEVELINE